MNWNILNLIVALLAAALPYFITWLKSYNAKIYLVVDSDINLYQQIIRNVEGLTINYENAQLGKTTRLIKCFVFYKGKDDITKDRISTPLRVQFADKTKIHECKVLGSVQGLEIETEVVENAVEFRFDLLKDKEYFYFEIFFEPENSESKYTVVNRISNVSPEVPTIDYFDISWRNEYRIYPFQLLMLMGLYFIIDININMMPHDKSNSIQILPIHFAKNIYFKNELINQDSIVSYTDSVSKLYQNNANTIVNGFSLKKSTEAQRLGIIKKLDKNLTDYQSNLAKTNNFFSSYTKADSLLKNKISTFKNFYMLFIESGPYELGDNYNVKFKYTYSFAFYLKIFGLIAYTVGAFFMFKYLRIGMRYRFIIERVRAYKKSEIKSS